VEAFEQGLAKAGHEGAFQRIADILAARLEDSSGGVASGIVQGVAPVFVAKHNIYAGDYDRAMDWIEKSFEVRDPELVYVGIDPPYGPLHSDPRFQELLRRMNLPTDLEEQR
jgi:hypothetical protein